MDNDHEILSAQMAAVNSAKSVELFDALRGTIQLNEVQTALDNSADRVLETQKLLENVEAYQVSPALVETVDERLARAGVEIPLEVGFAEVQGAEALGHTLLPKNFLFTRQAGCENFLTQFFRDSREVAIQIGAAFRDTWVLFTQSEADLNKALDLLETQINSYPDFMSTNSFILEFRLFNLFKVNGKVNGDWTGNLNKLSSTISALSSGYYLNNKQTLNALMSYFGGFTSLNQAAAMERLQILPISIPDIPFKECTYPNRTHESLLTTSKQSVELMGGAYFYDTRLKNRPKRCETIDLISEFIDLHIKNDRTAFENNADLVHDQVGTEIKALSSKEIKAIIKSLRALLKDWNSMFEKSEKFKVGDADFNDIIKGIIDAEIDETTRMYIAKWFGALVRHNQMELLQIRVGVANYLTLIVNGLIQICNNSIKVNAE
jgi:hypothetical protein